MPDKIYYVGKYVTNPHKIEENGYVRGAIVKGIGIGQSEAGGIIVNEQIVFYDTSVVLADNLMRSIQAYPESGFVAASKDDRPKTFQYRKKGELCIKKVEGEGWRYIPINEILGGICVNIRETNIAYAMKNHLSILRGMSKYIETLIGKQILRTHPSIGITVAPKPNIKTTENGKDVISEVQLRIRKNSLEPESIKKIQKVVAEKGTTIGMEGVNVLQGEKKEDHSENEVIKDDERFQLIEKIKSDPNRYFDKIVGMGKSIEDMTIDELKKITE